MSCTRSTLTVTAPLVTVKSVASKLAIPLLELVASSPDMVIVLVDTTVSIPSPPNMAKVSVSRFISSVVAASPLKLNTELEACQLTTPAPLVVNTYPALPSMSGKV